MPASTWIGAVETPSGLQLGLPVADVIACPKETFVDTLRIHGSIRGRLGRMAAGRALEIDFFRSSRCGVVVGDLRVSWIQETPGPSHVPLTPVEGVAVFADRRLATVLETALPELWAGSWLDRGTPTIRLGHPEQWLDFLDGRLPSTAGRGPGRLPL